MNPNEADNLNTNTHNSDDLYRSIDDDDDDETPF